MCRGRERLANVLMTRVKEYCTKGMTALAEIPLCAAPCCHLRTSVTTIREENPKTKNELGREHANSTRKDHRPFHPKEKDPPSGVSMKWDTKLRYKMPRRLHLWLNAQSLCAKKPSTLTGSYIHLCWKYSPHKWKVNEAKVGQSELCTDVDQNLQNDMFKDAAACSPPPFPRTEWHQDIPPNVITFHFLSHISRPTRWIGLLKALSGYWWDCHKADHDLCLTTGRWKKKMPLTCVIKRIFYRFILSSQDARLTTSCGFPSFAASFPVVIFRCFQ